MISIILNTGEIERVVYILHIQVEATFELEVTYLKNRIIEPCNWKLTIYRGSCTMHGKSEPPPTLTFPLMMERMLVIDEG